MIAFCMTCFFPWFHFAWFVNPIMIIKKPN
jgi:hypothetical protein